MQNNLTPRYIIIAVILGWAIWSLWPTYQYQSMSEERKEELRVSGELEQVESRIIRQGLDLKGGISATLEVSVKDILINYADNNLELKDKNGNLTSYGNFLQRLESADVTRRNSQEGFIDLFLDTYPYGAHTSCSDALRSQLSKKEIQFKSGAWREDNTVK